MNSPFHQQNFPDETKHFQAFDLVTEALESIDDYQKSESESKSKSKSKDEKFLREAGKYLEQALAYDPNYFKAKYFQAMVNYLLGTDDSLQMAINQFKETLELSSDGCLDAEIKYNLAVAYGEANNSGKAIEMFNEIIDNTDNNSDVHTLAMAGLLLTSAKKIKAEKGKDKQAASVAEPSEKDSDSHLKLENIETQRRLLETELNRKRGRLWPYKRARIDEDVSIEVERIINEANETIKGEVPDTSIKPSEQVSKTVEPQKERPGLSVKKIILIIVIITGILLLFALIVYLYLFYGLHNIKHILN